MRHASLGLVLLALFATAAGASEDDLLIVDPCFVGMDPAGLAGRMVKIDASLKRLDTGEMAIGGPCRPPILLVYPQGVMPAVAFTLEPSAALDAMRSAFERRESFTGTFIGRLDWAYTQRVSERRDRLERYGRAQLWMRLVLQRVVAVQP